MSSPLRIAIVGAGIQMAPNAVKVLRALGIEKRLRGDADPAWVYGYDAWSVPLAGEAPPVME